MEARSRESPRTFSSRLLFLLISLVPINTLNPKIKIWILICCPYSLILVKYQANSSCVIMSVILMTALFYKALISQGEIWCWSLVAFKRLTKGVELANWIYKQLTADLLNWQALFILQWANQYVISEQKIPLEGQKKSYMLERINYPCNKKFLRCSKTYAPDHQQLQQQQQHFISPHNIQEITFYNNSTDDDRGAGCPK